MNYGERLKYARKLRGLSQYELSDKSGVSQQAISSMESCKRGVSGATFSLASSLSVDPEWLALGKGEPETKREYGNERVPIIRWNQIEAAITGNSVEIESYLQEYLLEGRSLFGLPSTGIVNFNEPLGPRTREILVVDYSKTKIENQWQNLPFLTPLESLAIVSVPEKGPAVRVLAPSGQSIWLDDPTGRDKQQEYNPYTHKILGVVVGIVTPIGR